MNIFSREFLFSSQLPSITRHDQALFVAFGTILALAVAFWLLRMSSRDHQVRAGLFSRFFHGFLAFGILGAVWSLFRYIVVPVLGIRFVALLILFGFVVWLGFIVRYLITRFAAEVKEWEREQVKKRYLGATRS